MPSSDSAQPGHFRTPRGSKAGGRTLTNRLITVTPERRAEIDMHHLARALLRLSQEEYDRVQSSPAPAVSSEASPASIDAAAATLEPAPTASTVGTEAPHDTSNKHDRPPSAAE